MDFEVNFLGLHQQDIYALLPPRRINFLFGSFLPKMGPLEEIRNFREKDTIYLEFHPRPAIRPAGQARVMAKDFSTYFVQYFG